MIPRTLTGLRDTDMIILSKLDDRSLLSLCSANTYTNTLCKDENFWRNRTVKKYGNLFKYKPAFMSWRDYYLKIVVGLKSSQDIKSFPNLIVIYPTNNDIIIQYCNDININKILLITNEIRNQMITNYLLVGAGNFCPICKNKLSEISINCLNKCFLKDIQINDINKTFKAFITCPIVRGQCGHIFHNDCINAWRKKRDNCPLDNQKWLPYEMDSFVTGIIDDHEILKEEVNLLEIYEEKKREFKLENPNTPYDSFFYFKFKLDPNSDESLAMQREYENRKASYINSFHDRFPNSPGDPIYPPFNLFDYNEETFPRTI